MGGAVGSVPAAERLEEQVDHSRGDGDRGETVDRSAAAARSPTLARTAALAIHSFELSAARDSPRKTRSNMGVGVAAIAA